MADNDIENIRVIRLLVQTPDDELEAGRTYTVEQAGDRVFLAVALEDVFNAAEQALKARGFI